MSWAAFYEGPSDALYLDVLLPRLIREIVASEGADLVEVPDVPAVKLGRNDRSVAAVAEEACQFREAYDLVFIHADTGGRGLEQGLQNRADAYCRAFAEQCGWPEDKCITLTPRHETEAWLLADIHAVTSALGYAGDPAEIGLPANARAAERLNDAKQVLAAAIEAVSGSRRRQSISNIFPAIAQRQHFTTLMGSHSFSQFYEKVRQCLRRMGYLRE